MTAEGPRLDSSHDDGGALVLIGEIDTYTAPDLEVLLDALPVVCVVDLDGVTFIDSSGLRVIVDAHRSRHERGGGVTLRTPSPSVRRLLQISGVAGHLDIQG